MAKVKIFLEPHETQEDAQNLLLKALTHHENGAEHKQAFHQPAARDVFEFMNREHDAMWAKMCKEILEVIEQEA